VVRWTERVLVVAGLATLTWCALLLVDARLTQRTARETLARVGRLEAPASVSSTPVRGTPLAALSIPRLNLSTVVLQGSDEATLRGGPGHIENTALPGERGNAGIAGHRDSFFRPLQRVRVGDDIFLDTPRKRVHYRVEWLRVVAPHDVSVLKPTPESTLTLVTCYPFGFVGAAPDRFVVHATRVTDLTPAAGMGGWLPRDHAVGTSGVVENSVDSTRSSVPVSQTPRATDDRVLVQQAIERFRLTYNARLVSHGERHRERPLMFERCEISVADDRASAGCRRGPRSVTPPAQMFWTFSLSRAHGGWAIKSVATE
jgi:sortase A